MSLLMVQLWFIDNGENLISTMPITGFEKVVFELVDAKEDTYFYEFRIFKVANKLLKIELRLIH